ncbi:hypothetical protein FEP87_05830 [Burkholderia multivorans]|nr:hypothetical protein [Burkholderia multivorans]
MRAGQGDRELDLAEGRRGRVRPSREADPPLRRGGRRDGIRRAGPGRHVRAQDRDLPAFVRRAREPLRLSARGHHLRSEHLRGRDRHRGAQQLRGRLHRSDALDQAEPAVRKGERRRLERVVLVPRQRSGARGDPHGVPLPRDPGRDGHGDRQRGPARRVCGSRSGAARARRGRDPEPPPRLHRPAARDRRQVQDRRREEGREPRVAQPAGREAARARARARHHELHRRGYRGSAREDRRGRRPPDQRDRGAADGRHEHRRRPVRPGQDVPAAGREVRARDEAGGRPSDPVHRGRKAAARGSGRRRAREGQDRDRDRQGRRARHRQEHRVGRAPVQQLRSRQHGRDGAVQRDPREGEGRRRGHHRAVRPDHAEPRGNGLRCLRNAARRLFPREEDSAADRRRDHVARAHGREDRAELRGPGRLRARCVALGVGRIEPAVRRRRGQVPRRAEGRLRADPRSAREPQGAADGDARRGAREQDQDRLGELHAGEAEVHRPPRIQELRPERTRELHRLGSVLPDLGSRGPVPGDPERRDRRRIGAPRVLRREVDARAADPGPLADRERRDRAAAGE